MASIQGKRGNGLFQMFKLIHAASLIELYLQDCFCFDGNILM